MTQEDLTKLAEEHIDNEEYEVMFRDKQPIWVVNNCYQAGFKKALELVCAQANRLQQFKGELFTVEDILKELS